MSVEQDSFNAIIYLVSDYLITLRLSLNRGFIDRVYIYPIDKNFFKYYSRVYYLGLEFTKRSIGNRSIFYFCPNYISKNFSKQNFLTLLNRLEISYFEDTIGVYIQ